jgi:hypothetical protein
VRHGEATWFAAIDTCAPLLGVGVRRLNGELGDACAVFNDRVHRFIQEKKVATVILVGRWALLSESSRYKEEPGSPIFIADDLSSGNSASSNRDVFARGMEKTIKTLVGEGRKVVLVSDVPEVGLRVPEILARHRREGLSEAIGPMREEYRERQRFVLDLLSKYQKSFGVEVIYPHEILCQNERCLVEIKDHSLYRDDDHISIYGALRLSPLFDAVFTRAPN